MKAHESLTSTPTPDVTESVRNASELTSEIDQVVLNVGEAKPNTDEQANLQERQRMLGRNILSSMPEAEPTTVNSPNNTESLATPDANRGGVIPGSEQVLQSAENSPSRPEHPDPREQARERVETWADDYRTVERQFVNYAKTAPQDTPEAIAKFQASLRRYEEDAGFSWRRLEEATLDAQRERAVSGLYATARLQGITTSIAEPSKTIEAAASCFYDERMSALKDEIAQDSDLSDEKRAAELKVLQQTWQKVNYYLQATGDYVLRREDAGTYHRIRTSAHNGMIRQLNAMNDLARAHGVTPFTPRNFMTNEFEYKGYLDRGSILNSRVEYDRETVLSYFTGVFRRDFDVALRRVDSSSSSLSHMASVYKSL